MHTNYDNCPTVVFYPHRWVQTFECRCGWRKYKAVRLLYTVLYWTINRTNTYF